MVPVGGAVVGDEDLAVAGREAEVATGELAVEEEQAVALPPDIERLAQREPQRRAPRLPNHDNRCIHPGGLLPDDDRERRFFHGPILGRTDDNWQTTTNC